MSTILALYGHPLKEHNGCLGLILTFGYHLPEDKPKLVAQSRLLPRNAFWSAFAAVSQQYRQV